jgi:hypothetical protein
VSMLIAAEDMQISLGNSMLSKLSEWCKFLPGLMLHSHNNRELCISRISDAHRDGQRAVVEHRLRRHTGASRVDAVKLQVS